MEQHATVLVTGGAGFIGSHVVDHLIAAGHRPRIYDLRPSPYHPEVELVEGDLGDLDRLATAMRGCDAVMHLAAAADVNEVEADPAESERRNARGTLHVLEAARRAEVQRVIYASTIWVYSDTEAELMDETLTLAPPSHLYTATKLAGELYCNSYRELYGLESTILRFGIPYGPRARPAAVIPAFVGRALSGEALTVAGDGSQSRRFVYVEDLADAVVRALAPVAANRTYNLVGSDDVTIAEIATTVCALVGDVEITRVPGRSGDFAGAPVCGERAAADLDWRPTTSFREGVRRYIAWHKEDAALAAAPSALRHRVAVGAWLLRRAALSFAFAALVATLLIGLASLAPVDGDMDVYDTFGAVLVLMLPFVLMSGFDWDPPRRRLIQTVCFTLAGVQLALVVVPWPGIFDGLADHHHVFFVLSALSACVAARIGSSSPRLRDLLAVAGE